MITRARKSIADGSKPESTMHNRREILRQVRSEEVANKLLAEIAPRFKDRNGGYVRIIHLPERLSDSSQMSIVELVDRKGEEVKPKAPEKSKAKPKKTKETKGKPAAGKEEKEKDSKKGGKEDEEGKWYWRFRKKKREGG
ncbi:MAG: hypothetical protein HY042_05230 [Spirochaetia bacterium]|nr:hypothetical protein [Spirochaetia bacterium]